MSEDEFKNLVDNLGNTPLESQLLHPNQKQDQDGA